MEEDYYKILGVGRSASQDDIQKAYRDLARKFHPDLNQEDKTAKRKFQQVQKAYDVLGDPDKREMYDQYGSGFESAGGNPQAGPRRYQAGGGQGGFEDLDFSQFFGQRTGGQADAGADPGFADFFRQFTGSRRSHARPQPTRGADLRHQVELPFDTAVSGGDVRLNVQRPGGKVEEITVKIPAGVDDGRKIRLRGQGEPSPAGGPAGDILITIRIAPHPCFRRNGENLEVDVPISIAEAVSGAKIEVPTPKGAIKLTVPAGSSSGRKLRVKGHGVPTKQGAGDLYAVLEIVIPDSVDDEGKRLIRQFDQRHPMNPRLELRW